MKYKFSHIFLSRKKKKKIMPDIQCFNVRCIYDLDRNTKRKKNGFDEKLKKKTLWSKQKKSLKLPHCYFYTASTSTISIKKITRFDFERLFRLRSMREEKKWSDMKWDSNNRKDFYVACIIVNCCTTARHQKKSKTWEKERENKVNGLWTFLKVPLRCYHQHA